MAKKNSISLQTAKSWAKNWRSKESTYNKYHECKAFNIPKIDLQEVLAEKGVASIRAYIGVDANGEEKLMIVGVNAQGKDMLTLTKDGTLAADGGAIYDFSKPCPTECDPESPLNES